jgi:hypothetical protein
LSFESEEDRQNLSKILEKFEEYTIGEVNETYERYVLNSRNQGVSESIEAYITDDILNIADDILIYGVGETEVIANADHDRKLHVYSDHKPLESIMKI